MGDFPHHLDIILLLKRHSPELISCARHVDENHSWVGRGEHTGWSPGAIGDMPLCSWL